MTNGTTDVAAAKPIRTRKVIHATYAKHGGSRGFTNVALTKRGGEIALDPHVTGSCVITFSEDAATAVRDTITEWLGERATTGAPALR